MIHRRKADDFADAENFRAGEITGTERTRIGDIQIDRVRIVFFQFDVYVCGITVVVHPHGKIFAAG